MRRHRLDRLSRLTQGAALVGLGTLAAACDNSPKYVNSTPPTEPIHVNATAEPTASDSASAPVAVAPPPSASAAPSASSSGRIIINAPPPSVPPHVNSPPKPPRTNG